MPPKCAHLVEMVGRTTSLGSSMCRHVLYLLVVAQFMCIAPHSLRPMIGAAIDFLVPEHATQTQPYSWKDTSAQVLFNSRLVYIFLLLTYKLLLLS